jgi:hypothetical protein
MTLDKPKPIERKRMEGFVRIAQNTVGTSLAAAVPTPALELTKTLGIAAADAWMFYDIYKIYYDERLSAQRLREMLGTAGIVIFTGGAVSYGALKVSQSLIGEFLNAVPFFGWLASGAMVGTSTVSIGLAWLAFVEAQYRNETGQLLSEPKTKKSKVTSGKKRIAIDTTQPDPADVTEPLEDAAEEAENVAETVQEDLEEGTEAITEDLSDAADAVLDEAVQNIEAATTDATATVQEAIGGPTEFEGIVADEEGRVEALHPEGKQSTNIEVEKYVVVRKAIINAMQAQDGNILFKELTQAVADQLPDDFDGSVRWYVTTVKLDLEARNIIERVPNESPQRLRLV